jgi:hypothetical protein
MLAAGLLLAGIILTIQYLSSLILSPQSSALRTRSFPCPTSLLSP